MKSMAMNVGQKKRNAFSHSTGTCCHRRLQKQMLWLNIKIWTVLWDCWSMEKVIRTGVSLYLICSTIASWSCLLS